MNSNGKGQRLYERARTLIPGGTQLLSKRPEMYLPGQWPAYYSKAEGCRIWDLDGRELIDMSINGVGACPLGYADPDVNAAVKDAVDRGSMTTLNSPEEVELAELLCELHPWAEMARYSRCGGEAMAIAVRIARAKTERSKVAFCGYHGWSDWYLAANLAEDDVLGQKDLLLPGLSPAGVPAGLKGTAYGFRHNRIEELQEIVRNHGSTLAAIIIEPQRYERPAPGFLEGVRAIANEIGAVLIFDEITCGLRLNTGGVHLLYGTDPDIAVFAKAISNGFPMAAIIGRRNVMDAAQNSFISSTYWTERIGPVAALATLRKHRKLKLGDRLVAAGLKVQEVWRTQAEKAGLKITAGHPDMPPLSHFHFDYPNARAVQTLYCQMMLNRGYIDNTTFYATYAHTDKIISDYASVVGEVFAGLAEAVKTEKVTAMLNGPVGHSGFARLTS